MKNILIASILLVVLLGCSKIVNNAIDNIQYEVIDIDVELDRDIESVVESFMQADFSNAPQVKVNTKLRITNNNNVSITIDNIHYVAYLIDIPLVDGVVNNTIPIGAKSSTVVNLPLVMSMTDLTKNNISFKEIENLDLFVIKGKGRIKSSLGSILISFDISNGKFQVTDIKYE